MKYIYEAKRRGAKILCIDPVLTQTAAKADEYWQIKASEDGALALGMARHILDKGLVDEDWLQAIVWLQGVYRLPSQRSDSEMGI